MAIVASQPALHELTREDRAFRDGDHVADEDLVEASSEGGSIVANLISVGKYDVRRIFGLDDLMKGNGETVGRIGGEQRVLDAENFAGRFGGGFSGGSFSLRTENNCS